MNDAAPDQFYAHQMAAFLESGCKVHCDLGLLGPGQDLVELAEQCVKRLARERCGPQLLVGPRFDFDVAPKSPDCDAAASSLGAVIHWRKAACGS